MATTAKIAATWWVVAPSWRRSLLVRFLASHYPHISSSYLISCLWSTYLLQRAQRRFTEAVHGQQSPVVLRTSSTDLEPAGDTFTHTKLPVRQPSTTFPLMTSHTIVSGRPSRGKHAVACTSSGTRSIKRKLQRV